MISRIVLRTLIVATAGFGASALAMTTKPPAQSATAPITAAWLVGVWGSAMGNSTIIGACETEDVVRFNRDGTYSDGGEHGRFRTDGARLTYFDRVLSDPEEPEDRSQFYKPKVSRIVRVNRNAFREDRDVMVRCPK